MKPPWDLVYFSGRRFVVFLGAMYSEKSTWKEEHSLEINDSVTGQFVVLRVVI